MATTYPSSERYEKLQVTTDPGVDVSSKPVSMSNKRARALWFTFTGGGTGVVLLQFNSPDAPTVWNDYITDITIEDGVHLIVDGGGYGTQWRATIENGGYAGGTIIVGFNW